MNDYLTVVGNIASDPQHTITPNGVSILNFRLASNHRRFDNKTGQWVETEPNWYSVSAFRRLADNGKVSLARGDSVIVSGKIRVRDWESNGRRGTSIDLEADTIGPDLRYGTVRYARARGDRAADGQSAAGADAQHPDASASTTDDQWTVPALGVDEQPGADASFADSGDAKHDEASDLERDSEPVPF